MKKADKEIARVILDSYNNGVNGHWQMKALWIWWPYRTLGLGESIIRSAINTGVKTRNIALLRASAGIIHRIIGVYGA